MLCEEVMTQEVATVQPQDSVLAAARQMRELDVGFLPVVQSDGAPVGTLTDRDIVLQVVAEERAPASTRVEQVMSSDVVTCSPEDDVRRAEELMSAHQISRVLCVDSDGSVAGVISLGDIAEAEAERTAGRTLSDVKLEQPPTH